MKKPTKPNKMARFYLSWILKCSLNLFSNRS